MTLSIIHLIQSSLHPEVTVTLSLSEGEWFAIYEEAKRQALTGIVFYGIQ